LSLENRGFIAGIDELCRRLPTNSS